MRLRKKSRFFLPLIFFLAFLLLSKYEDRHIIRNIDFAATVKIQDKIDKSVHLRVASFVDTIMEGSSFFAEPIFTGIVVVILTGLAVKKKRWRALCIPAAFILIVLIELYGKNVIHHPAPPFSMIKHTTSVFPANYINEQFSFPSGHTARAVFLSFCVYSLFIIHDSLFKKKTVRMLVVVGIMCYVMMVATSRIYLGHHWLSDVVGGVLLGSGLGLLTMTCVSPIIDRQ